MAEFFIMTMTNRFTGNIASAAMILGSLAGLGLASAPAQAGVFTLAPQKILPPDPPGTPIPGPATFVDQDTEWGAGTPEAIWSTWPNSTTGPTTPPGAPGGRHGTTGVDGYDNPSISHSGGGTFKIEYFGSGNAAITNDFKWNDVSVFGAHNGSTDGAAGSNNFGTLAVGANGTPKFTNPVYVSAVNGVLPFSFMAGSKSIGNGDPYIPGTSHYFATLDGTWGTLSGGAVIHGGPSVTLGLSDSGGNDDDAADFVVRITQVDVPEPSGILGLLAMSGLGLVSKMRKQK